MIGLGGVGGKLERGEDFAGSGTIAASPEFPSAIRTLRTKRARPVRLIAEPAKYLRNPASSSLANSASLGAVSSARGAKAYSLVLVAYLFHGQTARQSSQP